MMASAELTMSTSLLALLDDIAAILDDVALLSKVAAQKTTGVLGDDLALNAQQVAGVRAERELPVVWAVGKGSMVNKAILVPAALAISVWLPWAVAPLLMLGGAYLCLEGFEKLAHRWLHSPAERAAHEEELMHALADPAVDLQALERDKIKGAIRTDFVLSAEIITITLGVVQGLAWLQQLAVLAVVAVLMTVGVYGLVAGIVKIDDLGLYLTQRASALAQSFGRVLLAFAPWLMKALAVVGTAAMFLVGGGILVHGLGPLHHLLDGLLAGMAGWGASVFTVAVDGVVGMLAGALVYAGVTLFQAVKAKLKS